MKWHDCKIDPPKYLMVFDENIEGKWYRNFEKAFFDEEGFWKII